MSDASFAFRRRIESAFFQSMCHKYKVMLPQGPPLSMRHRRTSIVWSRPANVGRVSCFEMEKEAEMSHRVARTSPGFHFFFFFFFCKTFMEHSVCEQPETLAAGWMKMPVAL